MLRRWVKTAAYRLRVFQLVQHLHAEGARILMYHRFPQGDAANFAAQCAFLQARYDVVSLPELAARMQQGRSLKNLAVITIDDGYADVREVAFPILRRFGLPATLFVTTGFIEQTHWMPGDLVRFFFQTGGEAVFQVADEDGAMRTFEQRRAGDADRLRSLLKRVSNRARTEALARLRESEPLQGVTTLPPKYVPCTWEQLREMSREGITMRAHTVSHPILSRIEDQQEMEYEMVGSRRALERKLGVAVETFAYPNGGREDISPASIAFARANFRVAVTAMAGVNATTTDPYQLLRLPCDPDLPVPSLARMMAGSLRGPQRGEERLTPAASAEGRTGA